MHRMFARPKTLAATLLFISGIPILMSGARVVQIPLGALPLDAAKFLVAPVWHWFHALAGMSFAVLGPLQFAGVLRKRFGLLHRVMGRMFAVAGFVLGGSGLALFLRVENTSLPFVDVMRVAAGMALIVSLTLALLRIGQGRVQQHRAWMIRAYAVGAGSGAVSIVFFPIFLITGAVEGLVFDLVFVGSWLACIVVAEGVIARVAAPPQPLPDGEGKSDGEGRGLPNFHSRM